MTGRLLTRRTVPVLVAVLGLGTAGTAQASTVTASGGVLTVTAAPGETNVIAMHRAPDEGGNQVILVKDAVANQVGPNGNPIPSTVPLIGASITCTPSGEENEIKCTQPTFTAINVTLADGPDQFSPSINSGALPKITLNGGDGPDYLKGGNTGDEISGEAGDDQLFGRGGNDLLTPGQGADDLWGGGGGVTPNSNVPLPEDGVDTVVLTHATADQPLTVSLDDSANDLQGGTTDKDNVHSDIENVTGGAGNDTITGSAKDNVLTGGAGDDTLNGLAGHDTLAGSAGADTLTGADGNDLLYGLASDTAATTADGMTIASGGNGNDTVVAGNGNDAIGTHDGSDTIAAGDGANDIDAGTGNDAISAGGGSDHIDAGEGDDGTAATPIAAGGGANVITLGEGTDFVTSGAGNDTITGNGGDDTVNAGNGDNTVAGNVGNDTITTGSGIDGVTGGDGVDVIKTGDGNDTISGGLEADDMDAGAGTGDTISYEEKTAPVYAKVANEFISGTYCGTKAQDGQTCEGDKVVGAESLIGGTAGDHLIGSDAVNTLSGRDGNDKLEGLAAADKLFGDGGDDNLEGGAGGDDITGGDGTDYVSYRDTPANVTVTLDGSANDGAAGENDNIRPDVESIEGSLTGNDSLTGSDGPNTLSGLGGNDTLTGLGGNDTLEGGAGNDDMDGNLGGDVMTGGADVDTVHYENRSGTLNVTLDGVADDGAPGEGDNVSADTDNVLTGSGDDIIIGSDVANVLDGGAGNDTLDGLRGADVIKGRAGIDTVVYSGRPSDEVLFISMNNNADDGTRGPLEVNELDNLASDIENITTGESQDFVESSAAPNVIITGDGNDTIRATQGADTVNAGGGDDYIDGGADNDTIDGGLGADTIVGGAGDNDVADYSGRTNPVEVTLDDLANDGEAGEGDNVDSSTESVSGSVTTPPPANNGGDGGGGDGGDGGGGGQNPPATTTGSSATPPLVSSANQTTTTKDASSLEVESTLGKVTAKGRKVLVRGRILVKARGAQAQASAACKAGGKVVVTLRQGKAVVGKRTVRLNRSCGFRAPVRLAEGTAGKVRVQVRFLGNRSLKPTKRTTSLQVNG